jgi:heterodisulfide reductase subunit A
MSENLTSGVPAADTSAQAVAEAAIGATNGGERRVGVFICHCGGNISDYVDVDAVRAALKDEPGVVVSESPMFACSDGTQHEMIDAIRAQGLDGLVVAACSPKLHQVTFRNVAKRAGMNPYNYTQVNIREQASWVHSHDNEGATDKAIGLVRAGVAKTVLSDELQPLMVKTLPRTLVIGGGITGLRAALGLARVGLHVVLIEREDHLGGWMGGFGRTFPNDKVGSDQVAGLIEAIRGREDIDVYTSTDMASKSGSFGNYTCELSRRTPTGIEPLTIEVGAIVVATGFDSYAPDEGEYGYGIDGVVTLPEFKKMIDTASGRLVHQGRPVHSVAYIYCVGSRQEAPGNEYCSKFCCGATVHASILANKLDPNLRQYHLHRDVRTYGKQELLYEESRKLGSVFMKWDADTPPAVAKRPDGRLDVTVTDLLTDRREITLPVDLVVLVTGMVPRENAALTDVLKLPLGSDGFYNEIHPKLRPVETVVDGVLIAGCSQGPKTAPESVASGLAAVTQSAALLKKGIAELDPLVALVNVEKCLGSGACLSACPYSAITSIEFEGRQVAHVDPSSCKGCGGCVPICPNDAIDLLGYTDAQMRATISHLVKELVR